MTERHSGKAPGIPGVRAGAGRNGMPERRGYDRHLVHDADDAAADEALVRAHELRLEAMARLGVTQADLDAARAEALPAPEPPATSVL